MKFNSIIIQHLSDCCGCDITTPSGATTLSHDIEAKTGERLTPNTIKRLVGVIPYEFNPRSSTLDIIAEYLGFSCWDIYMDTLDNNISDFNAENPFIEVAMLPAGTNIYFTWEPNREISLRHSGEGRCEVMAVTNSKLSVGDVIVISQLGEGYPFYAREVIRNGVNVGSYRAAKTTGISNIEVR